MCAPRKKTQTKFIPVSRNGITLWRYLAPSPGEVISKMRNAGAELTALSRMIQWPKENHDKAKS